MSTLFANVLWHVYRVVVHRANYLERSGWGGSDRMGQGS